MKNGYEGKIKNSGAQVVEAPMKAEAKKGSSTVKTGNDLRQGK